jgi:hypothetical protein
MQRQRWGLVDAVAVAWALEVAFWIIVLTAYAALSSIHAEPYAWALAIIALGIIAVGVEWCVSTYRCPECDLVATRRELGGRRVERAGLSTQRTPG